MFKRPRIEATLMEQHVNARSAALSWLIAARRGKTRRVLAVGLMLSLCSTVAGAEEGRDYAPFAKIDGFERQQYNDTRFDGFNFQLDKQGHTTRVEGRKIEIWYVYYGQSQSPSNLEVIRTVTQQLDAVSGQIIWEKPEESWGDGNPGEDLVARYQSDGKPVWVSVVFGNGAGAYHFYVVEEKEFQPTTHLSQSDIQTALEKEGRVSLHINFDFDHATLRPDAAPILQEITQIMKGSPNLKLEVDGHTDGIGKDDYNQTLSEARAKAVVAALIANGIDGKRLTARGLGASKPVATNETESGRAENRRVELIRR